MVPLSLVSLKKRGRSQRGWGKWVNEWDQRSGGHRKQSQRSEVMKNWGHREKESVRNRSAEM